MNPAHPGDTLSFHMQPIRRAGGSWSGMTSIGQSLYPGEEPDDREGKRKQPTSKGGLLIEKEKPPR